MNYDPFLKVSVQVLFYVALIALIVVLILKKKKQLHVMQDDIKDGIKSETERDEDDLRRNNAN